jgi:3-oxoadipate enol-lactonase
MPNTISRRSVLQAAALGVSAGSAWAQSKGTGPDEYYNKKGPQVNVGPGLDIGYREAWLGAPWEKPEAMLMIHGNIESAVVWYGWVPKLGSEFRLLMPDMPGFGHSTLPANFQYTLPNVAGAMAKFLDKMGVESAHVVAAKTGGSIGVQFAASYPQRTKTLVLATAPLSPEAKQPNERPPQSPDEILDQSKRLGSAASKEQVAFYDKMIEATVPEPSRSMRKMLTEGRNSKYLEGLLPKIKAPTLVITSDRNAQVSVPEAAANQRMIPNARLLVITSDAYHIILANTDEVVANVRAFIRANHKG